VSLTPDELARYARHIVLHEIGGAGQQRLKAARILVVGAGGLGSPALLYLAAAGVGHLTLVEDDTVSLSNLQRQIIHGTPDVGAPKAATAAAAIARLNPHVTVDAHAVRLAAAAAARLVPGHDLVLDGSDNFDTRYAVNAACVAAGVPLLAAAMTQWEGQIGLYDPARGGPCYACVFPEPPAAELVPTCAQAGIVGALAGVMGSLMALESVKLLTGAGTSLRESLFLFDALHTDTRRIRTRQTRGCPVCGTAAPTW
jgi:molybdopterin/thiamine biosynthesis adenylyltransferase